MTSKKSINPSSHSFDILDEDPLSGSWYLSSGESMSNASRQGSVSWCLTTRIVPLLQAGHTCGRLNRVATAEWVNESMMEDQLSIVGLLILRDSPVFYAVRCILQDYLTALFSLGHWA